MDAATRKAKLADAKTWAGYRSASIARQTGTLVVVVDGFEQGLESPDDRYAPRWFTMCDEHSTCCGHDTLALAKSHASDPQGWCEECRGDGIKGGCVTWRTQGPESHASLSDPLRTMGSWTSGSPP